MRSIPPVLSTRVRCAPFHLAQDADPIGSAGAYDAFLFVEVPLPWARDISEHAPFDAMGAGASIIGADGRTWRPQGVVPGGDTTGRVRVIAMEQRSLPAATPYVRREWQVAPARVEALCRSLVAADDAGVAGFDDDRVAVGAEVVDLFVCTHGRRDVCCGSSGTVLHERLAAELEGDVDVRLWRVSHTGGHKFAPTALSFPDGYAWAHLQLGDALAIARRDVPAGVLEARCRGLSALPPAAQVADRELLSRVGWSWCSASRSVEVVEHGGPTRRSEVRVDASMADGGRLATMVQVELDREIPQPTCGDPVDAVAPMSPVWRTVRVDPLPTQ